MISFLKHLLEHLRSSFWPLPTAIVLLCFILAEGSFSLDSFLPGSVTDSSAKFSIEGVRSLLSTAASGVITLAALVFSTTLVALTLASSQFGPRLLHNFIRARTNQVTLGTFLGTFLFCLVALRSIRDDSAYHLPALTAFVLTVISLSLFLYFVHHLVRSLQAENIVESVATRLLDEIENFFPEAPSSDSGEDEAERERKAWDELEGEISVLSEKAGYLQFIDTRQLLELASVHDCRIRVIIRPGQLVLESGCLFACETSGEMSEEVKKQFLDCFIVGRQRTPEQDFEFEIRQLVEVGVRALSPGINDPFTAMNCIDLLTVALGRIAQRNLPENVFTGTTMFPGFNSGQPVFAIC